MRDSQSQAEPLERVAALAAAGDDVAFRRLALAVRPQLLRWALVQTANADDAEDVVQAALLRMHAALGSYQREARFTTWLYAVLRSAAADWRRRARRERARDARYARALPQATSPVDRTDRDRLLELVRTQLGALPARQREIFDLADLQGHSPAAVAALLDMNHNTVRAHLLRARRTLRARILAAHAALAEDA